MPTMQAADATAATRLRRTQAERSAEAQVKLLDSAISLIAERGWQRTSLADVGERAGFARSIAAHHFGDREGLLRAVAIRIRADFKSDRERDRVPDGLQCILWTVDAYIRANASRTKLARTLYFLFAEALMIGGELKAELQQFNTETLQLFETHIQKGIALGEIRPELNPQVEALIIVGMLRGMIGQHAYGEESVDLDQIRKALLINVRRVLQRPESTPIE